MKFDGNEFDFIYEIDVPFNWMCNSIIEKNFFFFLSLGSFEYM